MNLPTALDLIDADYAGALFTQWWQRHDHLDVDGIQASIWQAGDQYGLCCTGSNDGFDWARNFQLLPGWTGKGDSGRLYHRGIIKDARTIYAWTLRLPLAWVIGHSRGGGAAQIVGSSRGVPTLTVSAPRVLAPFQSQPPGHESVENVVLGCDIVPRVPVGYSHVGRVRRLTCKGWGFGHGTAAVRGHYEDARAKKEPTPHFPRRGAGSGLNLRRATPQPHPYTQNGPDNQARAVLLIPAR